MNFNSVFEELNKLYEEKPAKEEPEVAKNKKTGEATIDVKEGILDLACGAGNLASALGEEADTKSEVKEGILDLACGAGNLVGGLTEETDEEEVTNIEEMPVEEVEVRQLILECSKCGAIVIKDEADVVIDEESDLVNVEEACEYCEEKEGYKIIGVVAPYEAVEELEELLDMKPSVSLSLDGGQGNDVDVL